MKRGSYEKRGYRVFALMPSALKAQQVCVVSGSREVALSRATNFCKMLGYEFSHIEKERKPQCFA